MATPPTNPNGSFRAYTAGEILAFDIRTADVRQGNHPRHSRMFRESSVTREFLIDGEKFEDFAIYCLGATGQYFDSITGRFELTRLVPMRYPHREYLVATKIVSATGQGKVQGNDANGVPVYPDIRVQVQFEHAPFGVAADDDTPHEWNRYTQTLPSTPDVSYLNLPGGIMKYIRQEETGDPHGIPVPYSIGYPEAVTRIKRKWCRLPWDAWGAGTTLFERVYGDWEDGTRGYTGCVNNATFLGYPAGSLLFLGVEEEPVLDPVAEGDYGLSWDLTYEFLFKPAAPHTWLRYFNPAGTYFPGLNAHYLVGTGSTYYPTSSLPTSYSLFDAKDFTQLWEVG